MAAIAGTAPKGHEISRAPANETADSALLRAAIDNDILTLLFAHLPLALAFTAVNAALVVYLFSGHAPAALLWSWLAIVLIISGWRALVLLAYRREPRPLSLPRLWRLRFFVGAGLSGLC